ncbi:MAG: sigma-70 family RNA polymerase sigma factor [Defluviitaleaceae bacterium]|nr:sigma-70 family RNA polymerase sigma factor [Defluviitaleaceae bacterium]MCL2239760.1 sigma-70 family RNA polymerase sigma factor [Defluviitaleaceae bacterium]
MTSPRDEQLIQAARLGDTDALEALLSRFKPLVKAKAAAYFLSGGDRDDLIQEGMIGLYKAFLDYAPEKNPIFSAFASLCVNRQMLTAIKAATRQKHAPLNDSLTLERAEEAPENGSNPEALLISRESSQDITHFIQRNLSPLEYDVLMLHMEGMSHAQIAQTLNKPLKSVDNTLQRVRRKVGRELKAQKKGTI